MENLGGAARRGPSAAALERAFEIKSEKKELLEQYAKVREEMAEVVGKQDKGKALREKLGGGSQLNQGEGGEIEADLGRQLVALAEKKRELETRMEAKGIKRVEWSGQ